MSTIDVETVEDNDGVSNNISSTDINGYFVLILCGNSMGQFGKVQKQKLQENFFRVYVVSSTGEKIGKTTLASSSMFRIDFSLGGLLDLDAALIQTGNMEMIEVRRRLLCNEKHCTPPFVNITETKTSTASSSESSGQKPQKHLDDHNERVSRKRKEPTRLKMDFKAASKFESDLQYKAARREVELFVATPLHLFSEALSEPLVSQIETIDTRAAATKEALSIAQLMVRENESVRRNTAFLTKVTLHGPVYFNQPEFYALPAAFADPNEPPLPLLQEAYFIVGSDFDSRAVHRVRVTQMRAKETANGDDRIDLSAPRGGYIVGKPKRNADGISVLFVSECGRVYRERIKASCIDLLWVNEERDGDEIKLVLRRIGLRHNDQGGDKITVKTPFDQCS